LYKINSPSLSLDEIIDLVDLWGEKVTNLANSMVNFLWQILNQRVYLHGPFHEFLFKSTHI